MFNENISYCKYVKIIGSRDRFQFTKNLEKINQFELPKKLFQVTQVKFLKLKLFYIFQNFLYYILIKFHTAHNFKP